MGIVARTRSFITSRFSRPKPVDAQELADLYAAFLSTRRNLHGNYDAAGAGTETANIWASADRYDADSAHSRQVRHTLIARSRYEIGNNGYSDGIATTYANDLVGVGPTLRMQTNSPGFNQMVELTWFLWAKSIGFRRKLWCMAHAKHSDGESFGVLRKNPRVNHPVKLDVVLYEAEQCQTPILPYTEPGYIDGIKFDEFGNPEHYDILHQHPGTSNARVLFDMVPERVPADRVLHWFRLKRPGQHRAVPECSSTLNTGAAARRWRQAVLGAAENIADFSLFLKSQMSPETVARGVAAMSTIDIQKRMMTVLPMGWDAFQPHAEQPTATHAEFHKTLINEQARPRSMPYNKAACDSSSYNYASGRLDHQTYYGDLDVERADCDELALDVTFDVWFDYCIELFGWLGGNASAVGPNARLHDWDWPKHRVADVESEANANETKLTSGQVFLHRIASEMGLDIDDEVATAAKTFGVDEAEIRKRLLDITLPVEAPPAPGAPPNPENAVKALMRNLERRREGLTSKVNGNGVHHEN